MSSYRLFLSAFVSIYGVLFFMALAAAHGAGTPRLTNAEIGPYWISVWTEPDPPQVGDLHLTVALAEPGRANATIKEAGPPILNALIEAQLKPLDRRGEIISAVASHEQAINKLFYEADLDVPHPGRWEVTLLVKGLNGASGSISFELEVVESSIVNVGWLLIGAVVVFIATGVWALRGASTPNP